MLTFRTTLLTAFAASAAFALPAPQATADPSAVSDLHIDITCGCWNVCTLQQFAGVAVAECDRNCDPRFACETYEAMASTVPDASVSLIIAGTTQTKVKRRVPTGAPTLAVPESDLNSVISRSPSPEPEPMLPAKCVCVTSPCPCDGSDTSLNFKEKRDSGVGINNGLYSADRGVMMRNKRGYGSGTGVNNGLTTDDEGTLPFMDKRKANIEITISVTIKF